MDCDTLYSSQSEVVDFINLDCRPLKSKWRRLTVMRGGKLGTNFRQKRFFETNFQLTSMETKRSICGTHFISLFCFSVAATKGFYMKSCRVENNKPDRKLKIFSKRKAPNISAIISKDSER